VLHEIGHGAVLRAGVWRSAAAALAAAPILFQPTFWTRVHDHHHTYSNQVEDHDRRRISGRDEVGERLYEYRADNPWILFALTGAMHVVYYGQMLYFLKGVLQFRVTRRRVLAELSLNVAAAIAFVAAIGWNLALFALVPCALLGSTLQSLYLVSNHLTRPLTTETDTLRTAVSVRLFGDWSHLDFGRHVEHHLFPHAPGCDLRAVTALLRERHRTRFREGTVLGVLRELFRLPGYYLDNDVLTDQEARLRVRID
jgi:fatty acid desaturase